MTVSVLYPAEYTLLTTPEESYGSTWTAFYHGWESATHLKRSARSGWRSKERYQFAEANGYLPQFAYSSESYSESFTLSQGTVNADGSLGWRDSIQCGTVNANPRYQDPTAEANMRNSNANALVAMLNGQVRNQYYSTFETLYEGRKTKKMIADAAWSIATAARQVRRMQFKAAARTLGLRKAPKGAKRSRDLAGNWLEYRYGWGPLLYTVYGAMQQAHDRMKGQEPVRRASARRQSVLPVTDSTSGSFTSGIFGTSLGGSFARRNRSWCTVTSRAVAYYRVHNPGLAQSTSMGLTNPALVAWELTPLSFVVDWFVNVSDTLGQFDAWSGKTYLSGTMSHLMKGKRQVEPVKTSGSGKVYKLGRYVGEFAVFDRAVLSNPPTVMPMFDLSVTPKRLVDGIALLTQIFKR